jgi:aldehyde:ferredoxin oxidoreductase
MTLPTESTLLAEFTYELHPVERGYANRTLYINLDDDTIYEKPVTQQMKDVFTGGRGFGLKLLWDAVTPETKWNDPRNELIIANGPICGITAYPGSGKATVVTLGPLTENVIDSNVGGYFSPFLKFSGFDALEIQGKAAEDVIIFIDGDTGKVTIEPYPSGKTHLIGNILTANMVAMKRQACSAVRRAAAAYPCGDQLHLVSSAGRKRGSSRPAAAARDASSVIRRSPRSSAVSAT